MLYTFPPETTSFYPGCVFRGVTGLECPGCGTTRALHHLLHGRVGTAFALNPMIFAIMFVGLFTIPDFARGRTPRFLMKPWFAWSALVVVVAWWVVRNVW